MNKHTLVCPFEESFLSGFSGQSIVVHLTEHEKVQMAAETVRHQNTLYKVLLETPMALSSLPIELAWKDIPLRIMSPSLGDFPILANKLSLLRQLNLEIFFQDTNEVAYTNLRILSSLGISCGLIFTDQGPNWEALADLFAYFAYGRVHHAPIEPFHYLITKYQPTKRTDFSAVYFDDPNQFLHVSLRGEIALSKRELQEGKYILENLEQLPLVEEMTEYQKRLEAWRNFFLEPEGCAYCQGWRVCLGKFLPVVDETKACSELFTEIMDVCDSYLSKQKNQKQLWRL